MSVEDFDKKLFSFRFLKDNRKIYLNGIEVDLEKEKDYFIRTKGDNELYNLYRLAYTLYRDGDKERRLSFYGFMSEKDNEYFRQARNIIRKNKIEQLYE